MPELDPEMPRAWIEFADPSAKDQRIKADLTWLTSSWTCIFGRGCQGIYAERPDDGCCTLGAHFSGKADEKRVLKWATRLTPDDWQFHAKAEKKGIIVKGEDGDRKTRVVDGACIFLNRPGFSGGAGCALHGLALREGRSYVETKPDVCWQLPIRQAYEQAELPDGTTYEVVVLTEFDRRAWGEGGRELDWFCSTNTEAHVGSEPVYVSCRDELVAMIGAEAYDVLARYCAAHLEATRLVRGTLRIGLAPHLASPTAGATTP